MSSSTVDKLVRMANQIARNMALDADPVASIADHIASFWTARMKEQVFAHGPEGLDPLAFAALERLAIGVQPDHLGRVTDLADHGSDAG